jgi:hypothetical protein
MTTRIGEPRVVSGPTIPVLYPGEQASATAFEDNGDGTVTPIDWLIEPMPGWRGARLRALYRLRVWLGRQGRA